MTLFDAKAVVLFYLHLALNSLVPPAPQFNVVKALLSVQSKNWQNQHCFGGKGGKCNQDAPKSNFTTKCLNTFVVHCLQQKTCSCQNNRCSTLLKCLPSLYSEIWVLLIGKLWQAYSSVQKFKQNITFFGSVILRDSRA